MLSQTVEQQKLSLWDVSDPLRITRLGSQRFSLGLPSDLNVSMKMDEQFIAVSVFGAVTFYLFSKKTLNLHWQKTFDENMTEMTDFAYGKGLLLVYVSKRNNKSGECGTIQVYDVTSKTCLREMRITVKSKEIEELEHLVGFNSKFMVVAEKLSDFKLPHNMNIYDLEAVKNPKRTEDELLVHTLSVDFDFDE